MLLPTTLRSRGQIWNIYGYIATTQTLEFTSPPSSFFSSIPLYGRVHRIFTSGGGV